AVRTYMIEQGVPPEQLSAVGYGESIPVDTNKTTEGREANRRVAFNLIDRTKDTEAEDQP
ncbi:MAG: OmpA family protein, partial [Rhodobacterales bacterium]|nr:OmpA family protein [Rhodobacterales bacterium]